MTTTHKQPSKDQLKDVLAHLEELDNNINKARETIGQKGEHKLAQPEVRQSLQDTSGTIEAVISELEQIAQNPAVQAMIGAIPTIGPILNMLLKLVSVIPVENLPAAHGVFDVLFSQVQNWIGTVVQHINGQLAHH